MPKTGQAEAAAERRPKALDLRIAGARYRQIGAQLGVSYQTAYRDVQTALGELAPLQAGKAEKLRELELERCDKMQLGLWPKVRLGDEKAVRALVAVMDRRAKLLGLVRMASLALTPRLPQLTEARAGSRPLFPDDGPQPPPNPLVQMRRPSLNTAARMGSRWSSP